MVRPRQAKVTASVRFEDEIHEAIEILRCKLELSAKAQFPGAQVTVSEVIRMLIIDGLQRHKVLEVRK